MTTYYVRKTGNDNNGGTSPSVRSTGTDGVTAGTNTLTSASANWTAADIGHGIFIGGVNQWRIITNVTAVNTLIFSGATIAVATGRTWTIGGAFLTIGKNLSGTNPDQATGSITYIGAGTYREVISVGITSPTTETKIIGDVDGAQTGDIGLVVLTAFTTNDTTAASASNLIFLNGKNFLTFQNIVFIGGTGSNTIVLGGSSNNISFIDCVVNGFASSGIVIDVLSAAGVALNWTIRRCALYGRSTVMQFNLTRHSADYDVNVLVENCFVLALSNSTVFVTSNGAGAGSGGGVDILNCTLIAAVRGLQTTTTTLSTSIPCTVNNCFIVSATAGIAAAAAGQVTEDYNLIKSATTLVNVTAGTHSQSVYAPLIHVNKADNLGGTVQRMFGEPWPGSPLLGFGGASPPSTDLLNNPRPSGGASASVAVGALERSNTFGKETGTVRTGSNALSITGPGFQDFELPVAASALTVSVYVRWDATYAGTKPKMQVLNGTECGVTAATATAVGSSGAWEQLSLSFTPTSAGIVTIRFLSSDTNGGGKMFVDDFAAT